MLTPMDIHNKEFKRGFRGYSEEDVDSFMDDLASDYEKVYREYCELKETCAKLQDKLSQYENMEDTMRTIPTNLAGVSISPKTRTPMKAPTRGSTVAKIAALLVSIWFSPTVYNP